MANGTWQFDFMSGEGIQTILNANRNQGHTQYEMSLNHQDFETVIRALEFTYRHAGIKGRIELSDKSGEIVEEIASTYGIKFV